MKIGILSPGAMGTSIAAAMVLGGHDVYWAGDGRSEESHARASAHSLIDAGQLATLCSTCAIIVSVCPPHLAEPLAQDVAKSEFTGLYVDANAISPQRVQRMADTLAAAGIELVDGSIMGPPAWNAGTTCLCLSGERAAEAAALFAGSPVATRIAGDQVGQASAVKMCFAAYTKGTTALLTAVLGVADALDIRGELAHQWLAMGDDFTAKTEARTTGTTAKAWRFEGEMYEIADTFEAAGLPAGFHRAAADVYTRLAEFRGKETPSVEEMLAALARRAG